jgi:hypothetical protein
VLADLSAVVLHRAAGPLVEPQVRRRDIHLPGDELNGLVRKLRAARRKPGVLRVEPQEQREAQPRRPAFPRYQIPLVIQYRPLVDKLIEPERHTIHGHMVT